MTKHEQMCTKGTVWKPKTKRNGLRDEYERVVYKAQNKNTK